MSDLLAARSQMAMSLGFHIIFAAVSTIWAIWRRRFRLARILASMQVGLIMFGWGLAQFPYIVTPDLTFANTATPDSVLWPVLIALGAGALVLIPVFWYLYKVFKFAPSRDH